MYLEDQSTESNTSSATRSSRSVGLTSKNGNRLGIPNASCKSSLASNTSSAHIVGYACRSQPQQSLPVYLHLFPLALLRFKTLQATSIDINLDCNTFATVVLHLQGDSMLYRRLLATNVTWMFSRVVASFGCAHHAQVDVACDYRRMSTRDDRYGIKSLGELPQT